MICFSREFPKSARVLMLQGAEVVICPNSFFLNEDRSVLAYRTVVLQIRVIENTAGIIMVNYPTQKMMDIPVCFMLMEPNALPPVGETMNTLQKVLLFFYLGKWNERLPLMGAEDELPTAPHALAPRRGATSGTGDNSAVRDG